LINYPTQEQEKHILNLAHQANPHIHNLLDTHILLQMIDEVSAIHVSDNIKLMITKIIHTTRDKNPLLTYGSSPRGSLALLHTAQAIAYLEGRSEVHIDDVYRGILPALRHRIFLSYDAQVQNISADEILKRLIQQM
jgi:MoxR-like ATPase